MNKTFLNQPETKLLQALLIYMTRGIIYTDDRGRHNKTLESLKCPTANCILTTFMVVI